MSSVRRTCGHKTLVAVLAAAVLALIATLTPAGAQEEPTPDRPSDPWAVLKQLEGTWDGEIDGKLGTGRGVRRYQLILDDQFLLCRHRSVRLPQDKSPAGDQHEELGVFSFDRERQAIVYREYMIEGVVVRSRCQAAGSKLVCTSEAVESGPGIRSRLTLEITDRYRFTETY